MSLSLTKRRTPNILRVLNRIGQEEDLFSTLTDDLFHFHGFSPLKGIDNPDFSPALDFVEKEKEFAIKIEIPGMDKNDIDIEIDNNILILKGEKRVETKEENDETYVCERCYGAFRRQIELPENCDESKIEATYQNGVLNLKLPKTEILKKEKKKILIKS